MNELSLNQRTRYRPLIHAIVACLMFVLSLQPLLASSSIRIDSAPQQAAVFGEQRGSTYFYGFTPLELPREDMEGNRLAISKTGYETQRINVGNQTELSVSLARDRAIETVPAALRRACPPAGIEAYAEMAAAFRKVPTSLQIETPFTSLEVDDKQSLVVAARVVDRKGRADLRGIRRREGRAALEAALENRIRPVVEAVMASVRKVSCADYLTLRVFYSNSKLALDTKRIQVPWTQSYIYQQGSDIVYETKYGMRGENVTTIKIADSDGHYVDFFYLLGTE